MPKQSDFYSRVYEVVRQIPYGRVTSYGAVASYLGAASSSRLVGYAMNASHTLHPPIPAHRVVNRNGLLTGRHHFGHPDMMQNLLQSEGIKIVDHKIVNFQKLLWNPSLELKSTRS